MRHHPGWPLSARGYRGLSGAPAFEADIAERLVRRVDDEGVAGGQKTIGVRLPSGEAYAITKPEFAGQLLECSRSGPSPTSQR